MNREILTIRFEIHDGDVTEQFLWPLGQTALTDVVQAYFESGTWIISGNAGNVPFAGAAESKKQAILNYLAARLGLPEQKASE